MYQRPQHCEQHGLVSKTLDKTLWSSHMSVDALYDEHWLLAYEANVKGWLPSVSGTDHVAADPNFGFLKSRKVFFYDQSRATAAGTAPIPLPNIAYDYNFRDIHIAAGTARYPVAMV